MESKKEGISWRSQERKVLEPAFDIITPNATVFHVNLANKTEAERMAITDYNMKNIMSGGTQITDAKLPSYLTGIYI